GLRRTRLGEYLILGHRLNILIPSLSGVNAPKEGSRLLPAYKIYAITKCSWANLLHDGEIQFFLTLIQVIRTKKMGVFSKSSIHPKTIEIGITEPASPRLGSARSM